MRATRHSWLTRNRTHFLRTCLIGPWRDVRKDIGFKAPYHLPGVLLAAGWLPMRRLQNVVFLAIPPTSIGLQYPLLDVRKQNFGGESGIRTHGTLRYA